MLKRLSFVLLMVGACALVACGDDTKGKTPDKGVKLPDGGKLDTGGTKLDTGGAKLDTGGTKLDKGTTGDKGATGPCTPYAAKANSGKPCKADTECTADELCLANKAGTNGMCVGKCCADTVTPSNPNNLCPVVDKVKQMSQCAYKLKDQTGNELPFMACAWLCEITQSGTTKTYDCPDATNYACIATATAGVKVCEAK